jgi:hypothetical protein
MKQRPFASITWIRFNGSAALPRNTLSLLAGKSPATVGSPVTEAL